MAGKKHERRDDIDEKEWKKSKKIDIINDDDADVKTNSITLKRQLNHQENDAKEQPIKRTKLWRETIQDTSNNSESEEEDHIILNNICNDENPLIVVTLKIIVCKLNTSAQPFDYVLSMYNQLWLKLNSYFNSNMSKFTVINANNDQPSNLLDFIVRKLVYGKHSQMPSNVTRDEINNIKIMSKYTPSTPDGYVLWQQLY